MSAIRRRSLLGAASIACVVALSACSGVVRGAGADFVTGALGRLGEEDSTLVALQRGLADSAGVFLAGEFEGAVIGPAKATWSEMRLGLREEVDSASALLDALVRVSLQETLPASIDQSADVLEIRSQALARIFAEELSRALGEGVRIQLEPATTALVRGAVTSAVEGMESEFRPSLHALMRDLRDSLQVRIGDVDRTLAESRTVSGLRYALYGAGGVLLLVLGALGVGNHRRRGRALGALIDAIEQEGDEGTKRAAEACAREVGVHSWLGERVRSRTSAIREDRGGSGSSEEVQS